MPRMAAPHRRGEADRVQQHQKRRRYLQQEWHRVHRSPAPAAWRILEQLQDASPTRLPERRRARVPQQAGDLQQLQAARKLAPG